MRQSIFIGRIEEAPLLRTTQQGTPVANLKLAVLERKGETWEKHEFTLAVFGLAAKRVCAQGKVGDEVVAFCRPESREFTDAGGRKRRSEDHIASWIRVCQPEGADERS